MSATPSLFSSIFAAIFTPLAVLWYSMSRLALLLGDQLIKRPGLGRLGSPGIGERRLLMPIREQPVYVARRTWRRFRLHQLFDLIYLCAQLRKHTERVAELRRLLVPLGVVLGQVVIHALPVRVWEIGRAHV